MRNAANELRFSEAEGELSLSDNEKVSDITVSGDGSWQKKRVTPRSVALSQFLPVTLGNVSIIEFFPKHVFPVNHRRSEKKLSQNCTKIFLTLMTAL